MSLRVHVYSRRERWFWRLEEEGQSGWVEYTHPSGYDSAKEAADAGRLELAKRAIRHGWSDLNEAAKALTAWILDYFGGARASRVIVARRPVYRPGRQPMLPINGRAHP